MPKIAYIYLVIPGEKFPFPDLYKVGKTVHEYYRPRDSTLIRRVLNAYRGGEILGLFEVPSHHLNDIETSIIREFNTRFRSHPGHKEFYYGNHRLMMFYIAEKIFRIGNLAIQPNLFSENLSEVIAAEVTKRVEALVQAALAEAKHVAMDQLRAVVSHESSRDSPQIPSRTLFDLYKAVSQGHDKDRGAISRWLNANIDLYFVRVQDKIMCRLQKTSRELVAFTEEHDMKITHIAVNDDYLPLRIDTYSLYNIVTELFDAEAEELKETSLSFVKTFIEKFVKANSLPTSPIDGQKTSSCGMSHQLIRQNLRKYVQNLRQRCLEKEDIRRIYCEDGVSWAFIFTEICYFLFGRMIRQHKILDPKMIEDMLLENSFLKITDGSNTWFRLIL